MVQTRFHTLLRHRIEEEIRKCSDQAMAGGAIDYATYREQVGYIRGLRDVLTLCEDIEREFDNVTRYPGEGD